jgi:hypothetical protein
VGVPEKIGVNTMRELIDYAKKSPVNMGAMPQALPADGG